MRLIRHQLAARPPLSALARAFALRGAIIVVALAGAVAFTACAGSRTSVPGTTVVATSTPTISLSDNLARTPWRLTAMVVDGKSPQVVAGRAPSLTFHPQDGTISGNSGCNSYGGNYTLSGEVLSLSQMRQTLMACSGTGVMEQEDAYMRALGLVTRVGLNQANNTLALSTADGAVRLSFAPDLPA